MLKRFHIYTVPVTFLSLMTFSSLAQTPEYPAEVWLPSAIEASSGQTAKAPEIDHTVAFRTPEFRPDAPQAFLREIVSWVAANFDLPAIYDLPRIEFVPAMKLASMRYRGFLPGEWRENATFGVAAAEGPRQVVAIYDDTSRTIFLAESWSGETPAQLSVLVHEMVHHLQNAGSIKFECPGAREKPAYLAQNRWLEQFGLTLESEFDVDLFTVVVTSACIY